MIRGEELCWKLREHTELVYLVFFDYWTKEFMGKAWCGQVVDLCSQFHYVVTYSRYVLLR